MSNHPEKGEGAHPALATEAVRFLERDFNQCFTQMRHYDDQLWEICKFAFSGYSAVVALAVALYEYSRDKSVDLISAAIGLLLVSFVLGLFLFTLTIRNRVYFVLVTRYVNEHRGFFLNQRPLGFANLSRMYTNASQPPFFNWRSSQAWLSYIVACLNGVLAAGVGRFALRGQPDVWRLTAAIFLAIVALQMVPAVVYLKTRENKGASRAVFGSD